MAIAVEMPKMSDTMEEGVLVSWMVDEGASVAAGDIIAQVETDKATMDLEVYDDGVLLKRVIGEGDAVPIGGLIAVLGNAGEDISSILAKYGGTAGGDGAATPAPAPAEAAPEEEAPAPAPPAPVSEEGGRIKASPLARRMAQERGLDLSRIAGSGPDGRIVKRDVEAVGEGQPAAPAPQAPPTQGAPAPQVAPAPKPAPAPVAAPVATGDHYEPQRISQMRKAITRRLASSKFEAPHFYLQVDVDMAKSITFRKQINEMGQAQGLAKVSFNDLVTKACALALRQHPMVNASYLEKENEIRVYKQIHVAVAVAVDEGLVTPVIRNADNKGLAQIAAETRELAGKARDRTLQPAEMEGSTFSTSNLGMFGIERFTAIINPPNACILSIGAIRDTPVVENGEIVPGKRMTISLSCDHRIVDGAVGAKFLNTVQGYLEEPVTMML
ncbi:MAG: dihydrolipoamide acetyltransferase family protein [Bacteroidota bacterium]